MQPSKISFVVQAMAIKTGPNSFYKPIKDKEGFYTMPGFVFNENSRNGKHYDTVATVDCITNPNTRFFRMLTDGCLGGEHGHPFTNDLPRLLKIDEKNQALFIQKVFTGTLKDGSEVIWVRFKPAGPFGKYFEEALEDPNRNACISLRAACVEGPTIAGIRQLYPKYFVTFDGVMSGGYKSASKRVAAENMDGIVSMESYDDGFILTTDIDNLTPAMGQDLVAMENYNHDCLLEELKAESIIINQKIIRVDPTMSLDRTISSFHRRFF